MKCPINGLLLALCCVPLVAQLSAPKIGIARYPDGSLHTVQGLPSNMIVTNLPLDSAEAASFSDLGGIVSQNGTIRLLRPDFSTVAEYAAAERPLVTIDGELTSAFAWLPKAHTLLHWNGSEFNSLSLNPLELDGAVTNVRALGLTQAMLIVEHPDRSVSGITVSLRSGNLISSEALPGVRGYAFGQGYFVVYATDKQLVADDLRGYRRSVPIPASDFVIERMSSNWLHLYSPSLKQNWALHITHADFDLSGLPGLAQQVSQSGGVK